MQLPDEVVDNVRKRLRRIAGQVQGVERMLDEGRECRDVVTQISAATKALEQAASSSSPPGSPTASKPRATPRPTATRSKWCSGCS